MKEQGFDIRNKFLDWLKYKSEWYRGVLDQTPNADAKELLSLKIREVEQDITYWQDVTNAYQNHKDQYHLFVRGLPGEPSFTLLARDRSAPDMVRQWAYERQRDITNGVKPTTDQAQVDNARRIAKEMEKWRADNEGEWRKAKSYDQPPQATQE